LHEHNEAQRARELLARLQSGENIALVSDAGTPLISDPGFDLIRTVTQAGIKVVPIPGACAAIVALSACGLPTDRFSFEGFLPAKEAARRQRLQDLAYDTRTLVFYEAPHRLAATLTDIALCFGPDRETVVARELTKQFESIYHGTAQELGGRAKQDSNMGRGEIVIVVRGASTSHPVQHDVEKILRALCEELPPAQAAKLAAKITGEKRSGLYERAIALGVAAPRSKKKDD
jgi:16S rRNA (cytidine1402-2'-O)-methyltransferase